MCGGEEGKRRGRFLSEEEDGIEGCLGEGRETEKVWISWGYAYDLRMMLQLAMVLLV